MNSLTAESWVSMSSLIWSAILFLASVCATATPAVAINTMSNFFAFMGKFLDEIQVVSIRE